MSFLVLIALVLLSSNQLSFFFKYLIFFLSYDQNKFKNLTYF